MIFFLVLAIQGRNHRILKAKGQLISKAYCQAVNSSKKRTNEFVFTTMRRFFIHFLEEIEDSKKTFRNHLTLKSINLIEFTPNLLAIVFLLRF